MQRLFLRVPVKLVTASVGGLAEEVETSTHSRQVGAGLEVEEMTIYNVSASGRYFPRTYDMSTSDACKIARNLGIWPSCCDVFRASIGREPREMCASPMEPPFLVQS